MIFVFVSVPSHEVGVSLANSLVEAELAACVSIIPGLTSIYRWQGKVETAGEELLVVKSSAEHFPALEKQIRELHPYDVPEIVAVPASTVSLPYLAWLTGQLRPHS